MLLLLALVALAALNVRADNPIPYEELPLLPGADFVGFGYDIRFQDPVGALRLPLVKFNFDGQKQYFYPLYRNRVYRVPDEAFVRTVGRTTAENYAYTNSEELRSKWSIDVGLDFGHSGEKPEGTQEQLKKQEEEAHANGAEAEALANAKDDNNNAIPADKLTTDRRAAGYNDPIPSKFQKTSNGMWAVGVDFKFVQSTSEDNSQWIVQSEQNHQMFQVVLNKAIVRAGMRKDMNALTAKTYAENTATFRAFLDKYGTHYVASAMLGGVISAQSVVSRLANTTFQQIDVGLVVNVSFGGTEDNKNVTEQIIPKDQRCRDQGKSGWGYNTVSKSCVLPPSMICHSPMAKEEYGDSFEYDPSGFKIDDPATSIAPWRRGRKTAPAVSCVTRDGTQVCAFPKPPTVAVLPVGPGLRPTVMLFNSSEQFYDRYDIGITRQWRESQPSLIRWMQYIPSGGGITNPNNELAGLQFTYSADSYVGAQDDRPFWRYYIRGSANPGKAYVEIYLNDSDTRTLVATYPPTRHEIPLDEWIEFRASLYWDTQKMDLWINNSLTGGFVLYKDFEGVPFMRTAPAFDTVDIYAYSAGGGAVFFDELQFCNPAGGSAAQPLTRNQAISSTTKDLATVIGGNFDFKKATMDRRLSVRSSTNYKLVGGDTSLVDLLNPLNTLNVFQQWKETIPSNPAPSAFTLIEIADLFPNEVQCIAINPVEDICTNVREEMKNAIKDFLTQTVAGEYVVERGLIESALRLKYTKAEFIEVPASSPSS